MANFIKKTLYFLGLGGNEEDESEEYEDIYYSEEAMGSNDLARDRKILSEPKYYREDKDERIDRTQPGGREVSRFRPGRRGLLHSVKPEKKSRVFVIEPHEFEEVQVIGDNFKEEIPVIVNLQNTNTELSKRIVDFCSGLTYALEGEIKKVADKVFLITPYNVEVTSEEKEILEKKGLYNQF
ncbi:MAG: cell division protein SepF [Actinobacteria bacterium]|nr:cell division protein SepF [Actinomycetota bacterium]